MPPTKAKGKYDGELASPIVVRPIGPFESEEAIAAREATIFAEEMRRLELLHKPPISKSQLFSAGVFSCLIAPVPTYSRGFLRKPASFGNHPNCPFRATFHSLLAIPRCGLAPWSWP